MRAAGTRMTGYYGWCSLDVNRQYAKASSSATAIDMPWARTRTYTCFLLPPIIASTGPSPMLTESGLEDSRIVYAARVLLQLARSYSS